MTVRAPTTPKGATLPQTGNQTVPDVVAVPAADYGMLDVLRAQELNVRTPPGPGYSGQDPGSPPPVIPVSGGLVSGGNFFPGVSGGGVPVRGFIPPNGLAGFAQQTPAVQALYRRRGTGKRKKRASSSASSSPKRRTKKKRAGARGKLKKGSAAAKRYMASIRRKRKK